MLRRLEAATAHPELVAAGTLDVVVVGGGTTGVETAGAFAEIYHHALREEFPELDFSQTSIVLLEAGDTILSGYHPRMRRSARRMLERRGVDVRLGSPVAEVGPASVTLADGSEIPTGIVVWATGVHAPRLADSVGLPQASDGLLVGEPTPSGKPIQPPAVAPERPAAAPSVPGERRHALAKGGGLHAR